MVLHNVIGLFTSPRHEWEFIASHEEKSPTGPMLYIALLALIPSIAWFYGTTNVGWTVGDGDTLRFTTESAAVLIGLFYVAMVASVAAIGYAIHWMSATYKGHSSLPKGLTIAGLSATPMFVAGCIGFIPVFGLDLVIGVAAVGYSVYLLYLGLPLVMEIPEDRGFLFSSATIAVCMVILMVIMGGSVILWDMGAAPVFTD